LDEPEKEVQIMAPKIGPSVNVPTTDPLWVDQRLVDGKDLTPEESKIDSQQIQAMTEIEKAMQKPVQKGDFKGARARADVVEKQFKDLSPDNKKYIYEKLQTDNGLAEDFKYRFSTPTRDKLLKTLNPDHKEEHISKYTLVDAKEKAQKTLEMKTQEQLKQDSLNKQFEQANKKFEEMDKELKDKTSHIRN
jgi:hypothetical protein